MKNKMQYNDNINYNSYKKINRILFNVIDKHLNKIMFIKLKIMLTYCVIFIKFLI